MQTENLANNSHKQFYVLLNTNQIKLYTYPDLLKENPLLRKFLNSESTAYFLDEVFYHKHIPLSSITISAATTVIKATKYSTYCIIENSCDVATKYSIIKKLVKLSYLVGSVDKNNISTGPASCQNIENFCHWVITHLSTMLLNIKK